MKHIFAKVTVEQCAKILPDTPQSVVESIEKSIADGATLTTLYDLYDRYLTPYETIFETEQQDEPCWIETPEQS